MRLSAIHKRTAHNQRRGETAGWLEIRRELRGTETGMSRSRPDPVSFTEPYLGTVHTRQYSSHYVICGVVQEPRTVVSEVLHLLDEETRKHRASAHSDARRQLERLAQLGANWDGEGADPVAIEVLAKVREHLGVFSDVARILAPMARYEAPWLAAAPDGSVGIDWQYKARRLTVTYDAAGGDDFYAQGPDGDRAGEVFGDTDTTRLATWLFTGQWQTR